jgi:uncharacterized membrane protein YgcG
VSKRRRSTTPGRLNSPSTAPAVDTPSIHSARTPTHRRIELAGAIVVSLAILILPNIAGLTPPITALIQNVLPHNALDASDFDFSSFDATYDLSRDSDGRSHLATTETLIAQFPAEDQNTGIVRRIPNYYKGHSTDVHVTSVTDASGDPLEHTVNPVGDYTSVRITDGSYVHGDTTFVVSYDQTNVTSSHNTDEFYWDINGVDWAQSFGIVRATITIDPSLSSAVTNNVYCYTGDQGESSADCTITVTNNDGATIIEADSRWGGGEYSSLGANENLTVAVGFTPGTFASAPLDIPARIASAWFWFGGLATLGPVISVVSILLLAVAWKWNERRMSRPGSTVIAQYSPPLGLTVARAAYLLDTRSAKKRAFAADTVHQVVRKRLTLDRSKSGFTVRFTSKGASSVADKLSVLSAYQHVLVKDPQSRSLKGVVITKRNRTLRLAFGALRTRLVASVEGDFTSVPRFEDARTVLGLAAGIGAVIAFVVYGPRTGGTASSNLILLWGIIAIAAPVLSWVVLFRIHLPTARTLATVRVLEGLRVYMRLAEQDRMRVLQGPDTAEFVVKEEREVIALNEKLLGYAVLFGLEKRWAHQIGVSSTTASTASSSTAVDLVSGASIGSFVAAVSSTTPQSVSSSSGGSSDSSGGGGYSSSSGGSDGGGSSGGGGGGGGGDGI